MTPDEFKSIRLSLIRPDGRQASQIQIAAVIGVSADAVRSWEAGRRPIPGSVAALMRELRDRGSLHRRLADVLRGDSGLEQ